MEEKEGKGASTTIPQLTVHCWHRWHRKEEEGEGGTHVRKHSSSFPPFLGGFLFTRPSGEEGGGRQLLQDVERGMRRRDRVKEEEKGPLSFLRHGKEEKRRSPT